MVVVTWHQHDLTTLAERGADRAQHRLSHSERIARRPVTKFDHVAEQDQAIDAVERRKQASTRTVAAERVPLGARTKVQVGYDQRARGRSQSRSGVAGQSLADRLGEHEADVLLDDL